MIDEKKEIHNDDDFYPELEDKIFMCEVIGIGRKIYGKLKYSLKPVESKTFFDEGISDRYYDGYDMIINIIEPHVATFYFELKDDDHKARIIKTLNNWNVNFNELDLQDYPLYYLNKK